jgi:signal transduction histidine kinase
VIAQGDPRRVRQILSNLLSNARKFSPDEAPVEVVVKRDGADAIVSVTDHGPGIAAADQARVFDRFVRLEDHAREPGSGLGLFIARSLSAAQGGEVTVDSDGSSGTTFTLRLPAAEDAR